MKKVMVIFVFAILLIGIMGFAYADSGDHENSQVNSSSEVHGNDGALGAEASINASVNASHEQEREMEQNDSESAEKGKELDKNQTKMDNENDSENESETEVTYKYKGNDGKEYKLKIKSKIKNGESEQEIEFHGYNVSSKLKIHVENEGNESRLRVNLSNGKQKEVKVLPDVASQRAVQVFKSRNVTVQLKEVGNGTNSGVVYEAETEKEVKIFGFINTKAKVQATIDSNTGEVTNLVRPWWSFLASGFNSGNSTKGSQNVSSNESVNASQ